MAMNERNVALIAGATPSAKPHAPAKRNMWALPEAAGIEEQGLAEEQLWHRQGGDTIPSGLRVTWTTTPTSGNNSSGNCCYEWERQDRRRASVTRRVRGRVRGMPRPLEAHRASLLTGPLLRSTCPTKKISRRFIGDSDQFADGVRPGLFKLTHRDMARRALSRPEFLPKSSSGKTPSRGHHKLD